MSSETSPAKINNNSSSIKTAFRFSLILISITITLELAKHFLGWNNEVASNQDFIFILFTLTFAISIAVVFMMIKRHRDEDLGGFISFGKCVIAAFWMGIFYGILAVGWDFIFFKFFLKKEETILETESLYIFATSFFTIVLIGIVAGVILKRMPLGK